METSYVSGASHLPLMGETIGASSTARSSASATARRWSRATRTCATPTRELAEEVERLARGLLALGLEPGDRVGIWARTAPSGCSCSTPTAKAGVILVNINPAYRTSRARVRAAPVRLPRC